ncbi:hypothetical protein [Chondromyces apiculatus]|uniref:hypothetical protein n=1 Tax=Chondromyces apiculatus TaxID=51 RepID=UPI0012DD8B75|nr:hypothetical protein [Chondromyces apiculatus]
MGTDDNKEIARQAVNRLASLSRATSNEIETDANGDAVFTFNGKVYDLEVKGVSGKAKQVNQVRGLDYLTLLIWYKSTDAFLVIPPNDVVAILCRKVRGQHSGLSAESGVIHVNKTIRHRYAVSTSALDQAIEQAIIEGEAVWPQIVDTIAQARKAADEATRILSEMWPSCRLTVAELNKIKAKSEAHARKRRRPPS